MIACAHGAIVPSSIQSSRSPPKVGSLSEKTKPIPSCRRSYADRQASSKLAHVWALVVSAGRPVRGLNGSFLGLSGRSASGTYFHVTHWSRCRSSAGITSYFIVHPDVKCDGRNHKQRLVRIT